MCATSDNIFYTTAALKDVGYLLVDNKVYPPPDAGVQNKVRSSQPSPVDPSASPQPPQPPQPPALTPMHSAIQQQQQHIQVVLLGLASTKVRPVLCLLQPLRLVETRM